MNRLPLAFDRTSESVTEDLLAHLEAIDRSYCRIEFLPDGTVIDANRSFLRVFGYDRHDLVGRHHRRLVLPSVHESQEYERFWRTLRSGRFHSGVVERIAADGSPRWLQATYNPVLTGSGEVAKIVKYAVDVTGYKVADDIFEATSRVHRAQLEAIDRTSCRVEFASDGTIIDANGLFLDTIGWPAEELIFTNHRVILFDEDASSRDYLDFWRQLRNGIPQAGEFRRRAYDGTERWIQATYNPVVTKVGQVEKVVKYATDVTEDRLRRRQEVTHERLESIGTLAAGIAHEMNTPMQSIVSNLEYLGQADEQLTELEALLACLDGPDESVPEGYLERLRESYRRAKAAKIATQRRQAVEDSALSAQRIIGITRAMQRYSHVGQEEFIGCDLNEVVEQAVTISRSRWKHDATLNCDLAPGLPQLQGIPGDLCQVTVNLITNAVDAIVDQAQQEEAGSISVRTSATDSSSLRLEVTDNGCGMTAETRARVFDRFFTTKEVGRGTGQGLAIAHEIVVKRHGGDFDIDSTPGHGTTMRVTLPCAPAC